MGNFAENLNLGNRFRPPCFNRCHQFQTPSADHHETATARAHLPAEVGKNFAGKNLVTVVTQLYLYSEQQRVFGISNIYNCLGNQLYYLALLQCATTSSIICGSLSYQCNIRGGRKSPIQFGNTHLYDRLPYDL